MNRRDAFSLVELLVVIAIIAALMGLLIPAVQSVRASAARAKCQNNLKQIGLAMNAYAEQKGSLPPMCTGMLSNRWTGYTGFAMLLPFVEQQALFDRFKLDDWYGYDLGATNTSNISVFCCPSDTALGRTAPGGPRGNYVMNAGPDALSPEQYQNNSANPSRFDTRGVFSAHRGKRLKQITDGTTSTALICEVIAGTQDNQVGPSPHDIRGLWFDPFGGSTYSHYSPPNTSTPDELRDIYCPSTPPVPCRSIATEHLHRIAARSLHNGGVNLVLLLLSSCSSPKTQFLVNSADHGRPA